MAANSQFAIAVHVLTLIARSADEPLKSASIAKSVNTNPVVIRRVISQLNQAKLVASQTGSLGGTHLLAKPEKIKLADIYHAVCRGEVFALHGSPNRDCPVGRNIESVLCNLQKEIDVSVNSTLEKHTLADVLMEIG
jgi:Rrf2 family protein